MFGQDEEQPQQQLDGNPPEEKGDDEVKSLRDEVKNLRGRVSEAENNTRFWYEKANGGEGRQAAEADADDDPAPQLDEDLVDVLSSGDTKKVKETFRKLGFVSERDVQKRIAETRQQITQEAQLFGEYPDLKDQESPLFQATAAEYAELSKEFGNSPKTLKLAAKVAAAKIAYQPGTSRRQREDEDEEDRVERVSSQQGSRGRATSSRETKNEQFTDTQASIIRKFQAVGSTLTPESYRKRAETGVRMGARNAGVRKGK